MDNKISVVLATFNEEKNIADCLGSVKGFADEIVVVDGSSTDRTREIAKKYGAKVIKTTNPPVFHINKQKALDTVTGDWILQLDADERVTPQLAAEIKLVVGMSQDGLSKKTCNQDKMRLYFRHQRLVEKRDGKVGKDTGEVVAFFVPRRNNFLGKFLTYAGTYPDGVIRLVKNGRAWFPAKSVHEQIRVDGRVVWLCSDLIHLSNPTLVKYIQGARRYTALLANELQKQGVKYNPFLAVYYLAIKPIWVFFLLFIRHKGILDGVHGFLFSLFSALHFPVAYIKLWIK